MRMRRSTTSAIADTASRDTRMSEFSWGLAAYASPNERIMALRRSLATLTLTTPNAASRPSCSSGDPTLRARRAGRDWRRAPPLQEVEVDAGVRCIPVHVAHRDGEHVAAHGIDERLDLVRIGRGREFGATSSSLPPMLPEFRLERDGGSAHLARPRRGGHVLSRTVLGRVDHDRGEVRRECRLDRVEGLPVVEVKRDRDVGVGESTRDHVVDVLVAESLTFVGATWMKVGIPTRSTASMMPMVVSMLVVLKAPATRPRSAHSRMTSCPLTKGMGIPSTCCRRNRRGIARSSSSSRAALASGVSVMRNVRIV